MILYLSGPMSGFHEHNFPAFREAAWELRGMGYHVLDPSSYGVDEAESWEDCLRRDLKDVLKADGLALLPGWEHSKGAALEVHVAFSLGMECKPVQEWQP